MQVDFELLKNIYEKEIYVNVKNKNSLRKFEERKISYLFLVKQELESLTYNGGGYKVFLITKPKCRVIMNQSVYHKIVSHYISKTVLNPKLSIYLMDENAASRKNMGTSYALKKVKSDIEKMKKYEKFYFLKIDLKKYFFNIDHEILKSLIKEKVTDYEFIIISRIIDSTNKDYINKTIDKLEKNSTENLPRYNYGKGITIGSICSQFFAIFYLYKLHHYIKHDLHIKYFTIYMDDYIIMHHDKEYLKNVLKIIKTKLREEYKLEVNEKKTYITSSFYGIPFLGYTFKVRNKKTIVSLTKSARVKIKHNIKEKLYLYNHGMISFSKLYSSLQNYKYSYNFVKNNDIYNIFNKIF